ncbi:LCP family protein [Streptacidiphilus sp. MAP12-20]|uniref:LCP family protein n=1 Tax=Streptacidiphilus sp. MAP12-20 TaxID=3156299 RepID=UPI003516B932
MLTTAGIGYLYIKSLDANFKTGALGNGKVDVAAPKPDRFGHVPLNILVIGSDGRASSSDCSLGGSCDGSPPHADVEMLLHVSADRTNASVMSIPRDTRVDIPACTDAKGVTHPSRHFQIITDSLNYNVPGCVVDTWESLTHIHIDHWVMVDFSGVVKMADAIGGVQVCTRQNVVDYQVQTDANGVVHTPGSHLVLPAGTHSVSGVQALEWLRTRHAFEDGSDLGRAKAQHLYLNSMIRQMKSLNTLANPFKINSLAQAATKSIAADKDLGSIEALSSLALDLNKVPSDRITTVTVPNHYSTDPNTPNNEPVLLSDSASSLFAAIANDVPLDKQASSAPAPSATPAPAAPVDKSTVQLDVQNGSGTNGRGGAMTALLVGKGFTHALRDTRTVSYSLTTLVYPSSQQAEAQAVASTLGLPGSALKSSSSATKLTLQIGTDWKTGDTFASAAPKGGGVPTDAKAQNAADTSQCMDVNPAPYSSFSPSHTHYIYSWVGSTPPNVPQATG